MYEKVKNFLSQINGLNVGSMGISVSNPEKPVTLVWRILSILGEHSGDLVIILDEVQELGNVTAHLTKILANIFSTHPNITFCFTGSYVGLVKSLLDPKFDSPLYGRSPARLVITPFDETVSRQFLSAGLQEIEFSVDDIEDVINRFDGVPGWLTLYGNMITVSGASHQTALSETEKEAFKIQKRVLDHYLQGRDRKVHLAALRAIAAQATWSEIHGSIEALTGRKLNDASLKNTLDALTSAFLIEKTNSIYRTIDPVLRRFLLSGSYTTGG